MSERDVQHAIMLEFGARPNIRLWRQNTGLFYAPGPNGTFRRIRSSVEGSPDLIGLIGPVGRFLGIECKSETGKQTSEQIAFQRMVEQHGGIYILARSVDDVTRRLS